MPRIELKHITKKFGKFVAVDDLNMVIEDRSCVTLLGPSGCGKTTTLRMSAGRESRSEGIITINDKVVFSSEDGIDVPPDKRDVGFLFQNYALWPHMTVYKNIAFGLENLKWSKEAIKTRVEELLAMLKISEFAARYPSELSGGQQQKVMIAHNIAKEPDLFMLDEPFSNLDFRAREFLQDVFKGMVQQGVPILMVAHAFDGLPDIPIHLVVMNRGRITGDLSCQAGEVEEIIRKECEVKERCSSG